MYSLNDELLETVNKIIKQPNSVTTSKFQYTELQMNVMTLIINEIQSIMTKNIDNLQKDLFNNINVNINLDLIGKGTKVQKLSAITDMAKKFVEFKMNVDDTSGWEWEVPIIKGIGKEINGNKVRLVVNELALPWLVYWGGGIGFTKFNPKSVLAVTSKHSKRMYMFLAKYYEMGHLSMMPLSEFRKHLNIEDKYLKSSEIKKWVLEPAKKELSESADIWFDYELKTSLGSGKTFTHISIEIKGDRINKSAKKVSLFSEDGNSKEQYVNAWIGFYFASYEGFPAFLSKYIAKTNLYTELYEKVSKIKDMADSGKFGIGKEQVNKVRVFFQKILVEDFGFDVNNYELFGMNPIKTDKERQTDIKNNWLKK